MEHAPEAAVQPPFQSAMRRKSVFAEVGLVDEDTVRRERSPAPALVTDASRTRRRPARAVRFLSKESILGRNLVEETDGSNTDDDSAWETDDELKESGWGSLGIFKTQAQKNNNSMLLRAGLFALALVLMLPALQMSPLAAIGVRAGVIPTESIEMVKREDTNPNICKRWAHQCRRSWEIIGRL